MKQAIHCEASPTEDCSLDDDLAFSPADEIHPILGYVDPRLRLHVGYCTVCRLDSARTVADVLACMATRAR